MSLILQKLQTALSSFFTGINMSYCKYTLFYKQHFSSTQPKFYLTFL